MAHCRHFGVIGATAGMANKEPDGMPPLSPMGDFLTHRRRSTLSSYCAVCDSDPTVRQLSRRLWIVACNPGADGSVYTVIQNHLLTQAKRPYIVSESFSHRTRVILALTENVSAKE